MKDNIDRLLDALEHPENYPDAEVEQILADPEAREVYDMLRKTADASSPVPEINLDEEWQRFEAKQTKRKRVFMRRLPFMASRKTAAILITIVGTLAVVAATIGVTHYIGERKEIAQSQPVESAEPEKAITAERNPANADTIAKKEAPLPQTIVFKGENLETILADIARYYGASVKFNQDAAKSLQLYFEWNQALPLNEVVEQLNNFEQINITLTDIDRKMKRLIILFAVMLCVANAFAQKFSYRFNHTPLADALTQIARQHPDLHINFIYNELDKYPVTATIRTNDAYEALRQLIGLNPVSVIRSGGRFYIEALQHGKFIYHGRAVGSDNMPVAAATIMLLAPKDSAVITYGIADAEGRFSIPCDRRNVIAKLSCTGYITTYRSCQNFNCGTIVMPIHAVALSQVNVEAKTAAVYPDKTVFIPTARQKNASQTGADLIEHIGIPQLKVSISGNISTNSGSPVGIFIDFIPASSDDLTAMRISDVRRVEYYQNPTDPRMQGYSFAVNYVMAKYEDGGYVKGMGVGNLLSYSEQLLGIVRLQNKKMTYDLMGYGFNSDHKHNGSELTETYRLPQPDGEIKTFDRYSKTTSSKYSHQQYFAAFIATYNSDNVQASTRINGSIDRRPDDRSGTVMYTPADYPASDYSSTLFNSSKFISYNGSYFFSLPKSNTITFTPKYMYSHTRQNSSYLENGYAPILNNATDNTNLFRADLKYSHDFGRYGSILTLIRGIYEYNRTRYNGSVESLDKAKTSRIGVGANYSISVGSFRGTVGFGWDWDRLQFG